MSVSSVARRPQFQRRALQIDLTRGVRDWAPSRLRMARWATAALGRRASGCELSVRLVGRAESRRLNRRWRQVDKPTNVLSFPAPAELPVGLVGRGRVRLTQPRLLGDLVICPQVLRSEALDQGKPLTAHWAHMVVHGMLHLLGYDHELGFQEQQRMERREIRILRQFGYPNPYLARPTSLRQ